VLLLAALAASQAAPAPPPPKARLQATATVRIERPSTVTAKDWEQTPQPMKREVIVSDEQGRPILLRLVENQ
jgi:hypothetical protein